MSVPTAREVLKSAYEMIESLGFPRWKRSTDFLRAPQGPTGIGQCIGLNYDRVLKDSITVFCHVGVHHPSAQAIYESALGKPYRSPLEIVGTNLRFLVPGEPIVGFAHPGASYHIPRDHCPLEFVAQLRSEVLTYGIPFMDALMSETALLEALGHHRDYAKRAPYMRPILLHCMGRTTEAVAAVDRELAKLARERTPKEVPVWGFFERMREEFTK